MVDLKNWFEIFLGSEDVLRQYTLHIDIYYPEGITPFKNYTLTNFLRIYGWDSIAVKKLIFLPFNDLDKPKKNLWAVLERFCL